MGKRKRKITGLILGTVYVDPASIGATTASNTDVTVPGLTTAHKVVALPQSDLEAGLSILATYVPSVNTLRIRLYNMTAGAIDPASREWFFIAWIPT